VDPPLKLVADAKPNSTLDAIFRIRNSGTEAVKVDYVSESCGCLDPKVAPDEIKPGEIAEVSLRTIAITSPPGRAVWATVHFEESRVPPLRFDLRYTVQLPWSFASSEIVLRGKSGDEANAVLKVFKRGNRKRQDVTGFVSSVPHIRGIVDERNGRNGVGSCFKPIVYGGDQAGVSSTPTEAASRSPAATRCPIRCAALHRSAQRSQLRFRLQTIDIIEPLGAGS
jgi:hypothetical protein